jgi:hypothetical protein
LAFFFVRFWAFLSKGSAKNDLNKLQKAHVENFFREDSQKIDKIFDVSFSSTFWFYCVFRCYLVLGDGSSKALPKTFYQNNRVEKAFTKKLTKIQNRFFLNFLLSRFWAFLGEGISKAR